MTFHLLHDQNFNFDLVVFTPEHFAQLVAPPILIFLHGSGERGTDAGLPLKGIAQVFEDLQLPCVIIIPQCDWEHRAFYGEMEERIMHSIGKAVAEFGAEQSKVFLVGYSMGGSSSLWLAARHPQKFSKIACIAPGITWMGEEPPPKLPDEELELFNSMFVAANRTQTIAKKISHIPIWFLQGTADEPCPIEETRQLVWDLSNVGATPVFTQYEGIDHDILTMALGEEGLFSWLLAN